MTTPRRHRPAPAPVAGLVLALLLAATAAAQGNAVRPSPAAAGAALVDLLPATAVVVFTSDGAFEVPALGDVLAGLDLERAGATLAAFPAATGGDASDLAAISGLLDPRALLIETVAGACPEADHVLAPDGGAFLAGPTVAWLSVSPFNPLPGALLAVRPDDPDRTRTLLTAIRACLPQGTVLTQDDVEMLVVEDLGLPLVLAMIDDVAVLGSDPESVRAAVRLARGSDEPRFVDRPLGQAAPGAWADGLALAIDFAGLADVAEGFGAVAPGGFDAGAARVLAALRGFGGMVLHLRSDQAGVGIESVIVPDPVAGDAELARLITCVGCPPAATPLLIPSGAASVGAGSVAARDLFDWLDGFVVDVGAAMGERVDLRGALATFLGVDVDVALLDWWDGSWYGGRLDVHATDLRAYLGGAGTVTVLPVRDDAAARVGLEQWRELLARLPFLATPFMDGAGADTPAGPGGIVSVRTLEHRGLAFERWRVGPTTDLGLLVLDGHLVVTSPAATMRSVIDVHLGAPSVLDDPRLGPALAAVPPDAIGYSVDDVPRHLRGLAAISDLLSAPVATSLMFVITEARVEEHRVDGSWQLTGLEAWPDYFGDDPRPDGSPSAGALAVPSAVTLEITEDDVLSTGEYGLVFDLVGLQPGDVVQIEMLDPARGAIDTFLFLFDLGAGEVVAANDDAPGTDRSEIVFRVEPGVRYAVVASSYFGHETGRVTLATRVLQTAEGAVPGPSPAADPPEAEAPTIGFDDVLALFDVVTGLFDGLADRSGVAMGSTRVVDGRLRSTYLVPLR